MTLEHENLTVIGGDVLASGASNPRPCSGAGDTIVLPPGVERQILARTAARFMACGHGDAVVRVPGEDAPRGTPPWIA